MSRQTPIQSAFTLTEILAALVLATLVMTLLMGLTARISRTNKGIVLRRPDNTWQTQLKENLQSDFENCRSITVTPGEITFECYAVPRVVDLSFLTEVPAGHLPVQVTYTTVETRHGWSLLRNEKLLGYGDMDFEKSVLMAKGIQRFRTIDDLSTNAAPPVLRLELEGEAFVNDEKKIQFNLVRHGGIPE